VIFFFYFSSETYTRKFIWDYFPSGFFARLLVRIMHLQLAVPISWSDAAIVFGSDGDEVGFLTLKPENDKFSLGVIFFFSIVGKESKVSLFVCLFVCLFFVFFLNFLLFFR